MESPTSAALVCVIKPEGPTSHDVVARVRRALHLKRVGHAGTLDPAASGVLVLGIGQATRLLGYATLSQKTYLATFLFGSETTTDDAEGEVVKRAPVPESMAERAFAESVVAGLVGSQMQVPPAISAVRKGGERAYRAAQAGRPLELDPRPVEIIEASLQGIDTEGGQVRWLLSLNVSKGTYIRAIARDLGRRLGCYCHVERLARIQSGAVRHDSCFELEELDSKGMDAVIEHAMDPIALCNLTPHPVGERELRRALSGQPLAARDGDGELVGIVTADRLWGVFERRGERLFAKANLPQGVLRGPHGIA